MNLSRRSISCSIWRRCSLRIETPVNETVCEKYHDIIPRLLFWPYESMDI